MLGQARINALPAIADAQRLADKMLRREAPNFEKLNLGNGI
jgi:hypothetical protein